MGESFKAVCSLFLIAAILVAAFGWIDDRPNSATWLMRLGGPIVALAILGLLIKLQRRKDLAPDILHQMFGNYFNRDGFCFAFAAEVHDGVCYLAAYYQNQRDVLLHGQIAVRPAKGFFLTRQNIEALMFDVQCGPAEVGVVRLPVALPEKLQGKQQAFEVGASVAFPEGRGSRLRFRDGIFLRSNSNFGNAFGTAVVVAGAATGQLVLSRPATVKISLPSGVASELPASVTATDEVLWAPPADGVDPASEEMAV